MAKVYWFSDFSKNIDRLKKNCIWVATISELLKNMAIIKNILGIWILKHPILLNHFFIIIFVYSDGFYMQKHGVLIYILLSKIFAWKCLENHLLFWKMKWTKLMRKVQLFIQFYLVWPFMTLIHENKLFFVLVCITK